LAGRKSLLLIFSVLLILPLVSNGEAFLQTGLHMDVNLKPGESQTFQWGLFTELDEPVLVTLRAEGEGNELLSFPKTIDAQPGVWNAIEITITIPEDHPNDVILTPALFALIEGDKSTGFAINVQFRNVATIIIGDPVIEEVEEIVEEKAVEEVVEEEKTDEGPGGLILQAPEEEETAEGGGCLISTATYGSELASQVQMLREIRDNSLLETESGSAFMSGFNSIYYSFSPTIADLERQSPIFKEVVKITLTPLITSLSILNYVDMDSEAKVLGYGISLILLNIGMYFVAPAILITRLRR